MGHSPRLKLVSLVVLGFVAITLTGCASMPARKTGELSSGAVLIMPPRNVVQGGKPHPAGKDSGERFERYLVNRINQMTTFEAEALDDDDYNRFSHEEEVDSDEAASVARRLNKDYFFILTLGEFLDAAPMTFRSDYVTLRSARLYRTRDQEVVWKLTKPYRLSGSNPPSYYRFLDDFAVEIAARLKKYQ